VVALAALLLALMLWPRHAPPGRATTAVDRARPPRALPVFRTGAPPAQIASTGGSTAPIIDEVTLEKTEVCEGEENLVTVKAHAPDERDGPFLHALVAGRPGLRVVLRGNPNPRVAAEATVIVFGRNREATTAPVPPFLVKACKVDHQLVVVQRSLPNRDAELELTARVDPFGAAAPFRAVRYQWDFGDGATSVTDGPVQTHDYSHRPQDRLRSELLVRVEAFSAEGARVEGRTTIELLNPSFESLAEKGVVKVYAELQPRFPAPDATGLVRVRVRLWHPYSHTVRIERVRRVVLARNGPPAEPEEVRLAIPEIHPGETVDTPPFTSSLEHDSSSTLEPGSSSSSLGAEYYLEGHTEDGFRAVGNFAVLRPARVPTRDDHLPISALQTARVLRARKLLGQAYVTDEDIWRLERQGQMKDLEVPPARPSEGRGLPKKE
jgi:hypothetical protein